MPHAHILHTWAWGNSDPQCLHTYASSSGHWHNCSSNKHSREATKPYMIFVTDYPSPHSLLWSRTLVVFPFIPFTSKLAPVSPEQTKPDVGTAILCHCSSPLFCLVCLAIVCKNFGAEFSIALCLHLICKRASSFVGSCTLPQ